MLDVTFALTIVTLLALSFSSTRGTGLVLTTILLCLYPLFYSVAILLGGAAFLYFRLR